MASRPRHPNKDIEAAIRYAERCRWRYKQTGNSAHAWGRIYCPEKTPEGCALSVWSTPKNVIYHVMQIRRKVNLCAH